MTRIQSHLKIGASAAAILATFATFSPAFSGAFALREQSATYQGMSFAGAAAGDYLSSMFWNSAAAAAAPGMNAESHATLAIIQSEFEANPTLAGYDNVQDRNSGDIAQDGLIPASYFNYQINDRLFFGLAMNSPFAFTTKPQNTDWAGTAFAETSKVFSLNINPTLAYKLTPELTVGVGAQVEYFKVRLRSGDSPARAGLGLPALPGREVEGDDIGFGGTAGVIWEPRPGTSIGLGYRSAVDIELDGDCKGAGLSTLLTVGGACNGAANPGGGVKADLTLPDLVSLGLSHQVTDRFKVLGTVEWTNWSRAGTIQIIGDTGVQVDTFPLEYEDGWFYSLGAEYKYSPVLTLRAGIAYEESPIPDEEVRVSLGDADRVWVSAGATYEYSSKLAFDVAYTHIFVDDVNACETEANGCALLDADGESSADIISVAARYKFNAGEEPLEPLK